MYVEIKECKYRYIGIILTHTSHNSNTSNVHLPSSYNMYTHIHTCERTHVECA